MKKIISGILGLFVTVSVVGGIAYAQFVTPAASVQGISFTAGNADLKVWDGDSYESAFDALWNFNGLYPGYTASPTNFWLQNTSTAPVALDIKGTLRAGVTGNWDVWKNNVEVAITTSSTPPASNATDWLTLDEWYTTGNTLPGGPLAQTGEKQYFFHVRVLESATGIENTTLSSVDFDFVGTQVTPTPTP